jgi:hypothetical protein
MHELTELSREGMNQAWLVSKKYEIKVQCRTCRHGHSFGGSVLGCCRCNDLCGLCKTFRHEFSHNVFCLAAPQILFQIGDSPVLTFNIAATGARQTILYIFLSLLSFPGACPVIQMCCFLPRQAAMFLFFPCILGVKTPHSYSLRYSMS